MTPTDIAVLIASSATAGLMNAMAGGGTIVTFPTLLLLGEPAITANATSTVALLPGALASMAGFRREVATHREWLRALLAPSLLGGAIGAVALLLTPEKLFARLAPLLVLFATVLFMVQGMLAQRADRRRGGSADTSLAPPVRAGTPRGRRLAALALQFLTAIYGGYFGAGIGILMLTVLGLMGLRDIFAMNGLKNFFGFCINGVAAAYFIVRGAVEWPVALLMMGGSIAGGYGGAHFARRIGQAKARAAVVVIGLGVTAVLFWQQWRR